ncbi:MAG: carboxy terminal-processing peptidase, partial [Opitutaceae bacterium]|nr:carboxy terminal-processing peptidase [Opitutaceae bacterium]
MSSAYPCSRRRGVSRPWRGLLAVAAALVLLASAAPGAGTYELLSLERRREMQREVRVIIGLLENIHYHSKTFVEMKPEEILGSYMTRLDPLHLIFLASDEKYLRRRFGTTMKSSYLLAGDLYPAFEIHDIFKERWQARLQWLKARLDREFDLASDATLEIDREAAKYPAGAAEADALWEKLLAAWLIGERLDGRPADDARDAVARRVDRLDRGLGSADAEMIEEAFLNSVLELRDPHSGYHSWDSMLDLEVDLAGSFVGIGAEIKRVNGRAVIAHLTPGGAAEAAGEIRPGDLLVALADDGADLRSTEGMRLREILRLLRGEPGTRVRLAVRHGEGGETREVVVERRRIAVESDRARAFAFDVPSGGSDSAAVPVGVIELPSFYGEPGEEGKPGTSCADDVAELLRKLKERGMRGLVLDLRKNPGGRTDEAVRLAGHFIDTGPVMYFSGGEGGAGARPRVESDTVAGLVWDGPLVVLTSTGSASASELIAGALQAYGRAIVVGSGRTFGKGTSQSVIPLRDAAKGLGIAEGEHFGMVRITGQKFFLPDGNSTQLRGVASDVVLASASWGDERTESALSGALPWSAIAADDFAAQRARAVPAGVALGDERRARLVAGVAARMEALPEFAWDRRRLAYRAERDRSGPVELHLERRLARDAELEAERRALTDERRRLAGELDFRWSAVTLEVVAAQREAHEARLIGLADEAGIARGAFVARGVFARRSGSDGPWRELRLDAIDPGLLGDESEVLAAAFATGAGATLEPATLRAACAAMEDEEFDRAGVLLDRLAAASGLPRDSEAFQLGLVALLTRFVELHPPLVGDPAPLDIALR